MHHNNEAVVADRLSGGMAELTRELRRDVADASPQEIQFLKDVGRGEGRYNFVTLRRLSALSARSANPAHREALAEIIRADTLAGIHEVNVSIEELFLDETRAQSECDVEQLRFARRQDPTTRQRLTLALRRQLALTRRLLDHVAAL